MHHIFILISFQVLSGKHPWSEFKRDAAVMLQLSQGNKPERPSSRPIEDKHWELIERCRSSVDDRPCATDVVSSLQQFLHSCPPSPPLLDTFCFLSYFGIIPPHSSLVVPTPDRPREQNTGTLRPGISEVTLGGRSAVLQDSKRVLPTIGLMSPLAPVTEHPALPRLLSTNAIHTFGEMFPTMTESPDPDIRRELCPHSS